MSVRPGIFSALLPVLLALTPVASAAEIEWRESRYNPKPAPGDLILPMPCGGAMAFRFVATPHAEGGLADVAFEIGASEDDYGYLRGRRRGHLTGPFRDDDGFQGFYLAKYEVAQAQYDVVMSEGCPDRKPRRKDFVAAAGMTWFDAVRFTETYSIWLRREAPGALPSGAAAGYHLRLPTEEEWEYAARGGAQVGTAEFREPVYPLGDATLGEFEAYGGTSSANGKVQPIGSLAGNPVGLHDMLGNVAELTLEPFRMIRQGRRHGRVGGFVKRGADANTDATRVTAAARQEVRFFDPGSGEPVRDRYLGFRPVLTTIVLDSAEAARSYAEAARAAAQPDLQTELGEAEARALAELEAAAGIEDQAERRRAMIDIARRLDSVRAERNSQRDRAIESIFLAAASTCATGAQQIRTLRVLHRRRQTSEAALETARDMKARGELGPEALAELERAEAAFQTILDKIAEVDARLASYMDTYAEFIATLEGDYGPDVTDRQADLLRQKLAEGRGPALMGRCLGLGTAHLSETRRSGRLDVVDWVREIEQIIN